MWTVRGAVAALVLMLVLAMCLPEEGPAGGSAGVGVAWTA